MNWILIIVAGILLFFAVRGWCRGLLRILFALIAVFVLIGLMMYATPHVSEFIKTKTPIYTMVVEKCSDSLQSKVESGIESGLNSTVEDSTAGLPNKVASYITTGAENAIEETGVYDAVGTKVADWLLAGASFLIAFLLAIIIVKLVDNALKIANHIPVLKGVNRTLGIVAGVIEGLVIVYLLFMFIALIANSSLGQTCIACIDDNKFLSTLYYQNVILKFFNFA